MEHDDRHRCSFLLSVFLSVVAQPCMNMLCEERLICTAVTLALKLNNGEKKETGRMGEGLAYETK